MNSILISIFDFFERRKLLLWLILSGIVTLLAVSSARISFVEDISSFMPDDYGNNIIKESYQKTSAANKIIVTVSQLAATEHTDKDLLTDAATRFAEILQDSDSLEYIKDLIFEVDNENIKNVTGFIAQNLPCFLEDEDYLRIDSLIQPQVIENRLKADKEILLSPMGGFVREMLSNDPLQFSERVLKNLESFRQNDSYTTDNGFIFNSRGDAVVIITSKYPVSETANNKMLADEIYSAANMTVNEFSGQIGIVPFGTALISITNADQLKNDSVFALSIALVLILALLLYFFRDIKSLFFIVLPVTFGALFALGVIAVFRSTVSIIAIGIASIIVGIAINYPLHFLAHLRHNPDIRQSLKEIVNPLVTGNITTIGAFLSLLFISSDAMKDLGLFSAFFLAGTILFVLIFLPHFIGKGKVRTAPAKTHFGRLPEFSPEKNKFIVSIFFIFTVVLFFFSFGTKLETDLHSISYMTDGQRAEMNRLIEKNRGRGKTLCVATKGKTTEEALQNYEKEVAPLLTASGITGRTANNIPFVSYSGISHFFPSKEMQKQKIERWNEFWKDKKADFQNTFIQIAREEGFRSGVFDNFNGVLEKDFQPQEFSCFQPLYRGFGENYFSIQSDRTVIYSVLTVPDSARFLTPVNFSNSFSFDDSSIAQRMVAALSSSFNNVLYICAFIVFAFLFFSFGKLEIAILTFIPMLVAWVWILGLMNILGLKFNIINIILATFIFGQGDDYTIFITEGLIYEYTCRKKTLASFKNSIILSATILFIAIGMLIFARHPAMRSLAELTIVGMISVVLCAYLFPPLVFTYLTNKNGKPREAPWTLWRFLKNVYSFTVFLSGSLFITVSGFILLGFRKKPDEKNKLRYHKLLQRAAGFVIRRVPDVKFCYKNLSGETFETPAVIIANHQSHLDLMCLMMLTPKLIILTNDWVWRSPYYGRLIRYADFYPVSQGIENCLEQLSDAVRRGYSIVIFPEGTRSADCSIGRFHRGAFYLAEKLKLDILPVFLHGAGHVLPKNDFLLRAGQITVQVHRRITPANIDYPALTKQICQYYRTTFAEISGKIETPDYFKSFVLHNYMYKGVKVWREAKAECKRVLNTPVIQHAPERVLIENNGYGVPGFLYALANKNTQVIAIEEDIDKVAIARACAGLPKNLTIYHISEWKNV
jgi:1-acyl-sn-glycerol-3-phosphate acyltransferase